MYMTSEQSTLDKIRTRPRFKLFTDLQPSEYENRLRNYLKENKNQYEGSINREVATISVKTPVDTYWKPYLSLRTEIEDGKTAIRGVFGPSSAVWTFFMFLYFFFSVAWMTCITIWFVEKQIGSTSYPWALPVSFIFLALILLTYLAAQLGQKKGKKEMELLRKFAEESTYPHEKQ